jgi:hypothetical protein
MAVKYILTAIPVHFPHVYYGLPNNETRKNVCSCYNSGHYPSIILPSISFYFCIIWGAVRMSPLGTSVTIWPIVLAPDDDDDDDDECGAVGGMIGKGNRSTRRKTTPAPLCLLQISHDVTRARTRAAAVGRHANNLLNYGSVSVLYLQQRFGDWILSQSSGGTCSVWPNIRSGDRD